MTMTVAVYQSFNKLRYGNPWLARIRLEGDSLKFDFDAKAFKGDSEKGGNLTAELEEGDFFAFGQKDYMGRNSTAWMGRLHEGKMIEMTKRSILSRLKEETDGKEADGRKGEDGKTAPREQSGAEAQ